MIDDATIREAIRYLRARGFDVARSGSEWRVGRKLQSTIDMIGLAVRERELDNGVEPPSSDALKPSSLAKLGRCPLIADGGVKGIATDAHDPSVADYRDTSPRAQRVGRGAERRSPSPRAHRDLSEAIIHLAVMRLGDVEDIREALIAQAVGCVHAAGMLVAALPEAASRAAVVRELKRFLPESVDRRAGELHRGGLT